MVIVRISSGEVLGLFSYGEIKSGGVARWKKKVVPVFFWGRTKHISKSSSIKIHTLWRVATRWSCFPQECIYTIHSSLAMKWNLISKHEIFLVRILNIISSCSNFAARNLREKQQMTLANQTGDESSSNDAWKETHAFRHWVTRGSDGLDGGVFRWRSRGALGENGGWGCYVPPPQTCLAFFNVFQMAPKTLGDLVAVPGDFFAGRFGVEGVAILCRKQLPPEAFDRREINFTTVPTKISSTFCS